MIERLRRYKGALAYRVTARVFEHDCLGMAAEAAFRFLLSFVPAVIFLVALTSVVGLSEQSIAFVVSSLSAVMPVGSADVVGAVVRAALENPATGLLTTSLLLTVWTASGVTGTLTKASNRAYDCPSTRYTFWRNRVVSMLLVPVIAVPVAAGAVMVVFGGAIANAVVRYGHLMFLAGWLGWATRWAITLAFVVLILALLFKISPARRLSLVRVLPGAVVATVLWVLVSIVFRELTLSGSTGYKIYGSLAAVVVFLFWSYLSAIAFVIGIELNAELDVRRAACEASLDESGDPTLRAPDGFHPVTPPGSAVVD